MLRQSTALAATVYGDRADEIRSEALMKLDFGPGRLPGMLVFGSEDPHQFKPTHGTDLLAFFAGRLRTDDAPVAGAERDAFLAPALRGRAGASGWPICAR